MKRFTILGLLLVFGVSVYSQTISQFTWDTNPLATAVWDAQVGSDGTSWGTASRQVTPGYAGFGLAPGCAACIGSSCGVAGQCRQNINLIVPFTPPTSITVDLMYRQLGSEGAASFFSVVNGQAAGSTTWMRFGTGCCGIVSIGYLVSDGMGGSTLIGSPSNPASGDFTAGAPGQTFAGAVNNTWVNYRFTYDAATGIGEVFQDNVSKWVYSGTPGMPLYWTGAPAEYRIGQFTDGNGNALATFDSYTVSIPPVLPVTVGNFTGVNDLGRAKLSWVSYTETQNSHYTIERFSKDLGQYEVIGTVNGAIDSDTEVDYVFWDENPSFGQNSYILRQHDINGISRAVGVTEVYLSGFYTQVYSINPNPVESGSPLNVGVQIADDRSGHLTVIDLSGRVVSQMAEPILPGRNEVEVPTNGLKAGVYFVEISDGERRIVKKFVVI